MVIKDCKKGRKLCSVGGLKLHTYGTPRFLSLNFDVLVTLELFESLIEWG